MICNLESILMQETEEGEKRTELADAIKSLKQVAIAELQEEPNHALTEDQQNAIAYAESIIDLKKENDAKITKEEIEEKEVEPKVEPVAEPVIEPVTPVETEVKEEIKEEVKEEVKEIVEEKSEKTEDLEKVGRAISSSNGEKISTALKQLQEAVRVLSELGIAGGLTPSEQDKTDNGNMPEQGSTGSFGQAGQVKPADAQTTVETRQVGGKSEEPTTVLKAEIEEGKDIAKMEAELISIKEQLAKIQNQPLAIKAKASYATVEKSFEGGSNVLAQEELLKAEAESMELQKMLALPHGVDVENRAKDLSLKIMRLRREAKA